MTDPFYAVMNKVQSSLVHLRATIERGDSLSRDGRDSSEVEPILSEARQSMSAIHIDVKDLAQTITIVEGNRDRFKDIDNRELDKRRAFVTDAKTTLSQSEEEIKRISFQTQQANNKRKALLASSASHGLGGNSRFNNSIAAESSRANDDFVASSRQQAQMYEKEQDLVLDDMAHALDRLKGIGESIHIELKESDAQLNALDDELETANNTMQTVLKKMDKLLKSSDRGRLCCIVILFVVAIALFFGIVYG